MREKLNKLISIAIENSNLEDKDFSKLNGKVILIDLKNTNTDIYFLVENNCIAIIENADLEPNLILEGTPIGFINYTNNFGNEHNIKISGDASLAESFSKLAEKTNIDWESIIAEYINDDVAFYSSKIFEYVKSITETRDTKKLVNLVVLTFQTRATRGVGKGERKLFYDMFMAVQKYMGNNVVMELSHIIPKYGYYKDYLYIMKDPLCSCELYNHCINILCDQIALDYTKFTRKEEVSILAKYMPREKGEFSKIAFEISDKMFKGNKFQKLLAL